MKKVIASSMVHLVCMIRDGENIRYQEFNIDIKDALTPEMIHDTVKPQICKHVGTDEVIILNWQRYEM